MRGWEDICVISEGFTGRDRLASGLAGNGCREHATDGVVRGIGDEFTRIGDNCGRANVAADGEGNCCRLGNVEEDGWSSRGANKGGAGEVVGFVHVSYPCSSREVGRCSGVVENQRFPSE